MSACGVQETRATRRRSLLATALSNQADVTVEMDATSSDAAQSALTELTNAVGNSTTSDLVVSLCLQCELDSWLGSMFNVTCIISNQYPSHHHCACFPTLVTPFNFIIVSTVQAHPSAMQTFLPFSYSGLCRNLSSMLLRALILNCQPNCCWHIVYAVEQH